jgi:Phage tail lysozyme
MADDFKTRAYQFYVSQGLAPYKAAALAGHADQESGGRTNVYGDGGKAFGIMQWHPDRQQGLAQYARDNRLDPTDETTQLKFVLHEMNTTERGAGAKLQDAKNFKEANDAMMAYLRPAGYTPDNPAGGHNYAGRWNAGAGFVGEKPMPGGATAAAGGSDATASTAPPTGGISPEVIAGLLAKQQEQSAATAKAAALAEEAKQQAGMQSLIKQGTGLLAAGETPAPQMAMPSAAIHRPQVQPLALGGGTPDFATMLARQRLMRRV